MQFSTVAVIAALTAGVAAESCNAGGVYCGSSLLHKGNYREHIERVLKKAHQSISEEHVQRSLFDCLKDGEIRYIKYCSKGCGNTDNTKPDYCKK